MWRLRTFQLAGSYNIFRISDTKFEICLLYLVCTWHMRKNTFVCVRMLLEVSRAHMHITGLR
jgi:hypothetical protein